MLGSPEKLVWGCLGLSKAAVGLVSGQRRRGQGGATGLAGGPAR